MAQFRQDIHDVIRTGICYRIKCKQCRKCRIICGKARRYILLALNNSFVDRPDGGHAFIVEEAKWN
jgi:ribosomal protein S27E